jgi:hypothetical protein
MLELTLQRLPTIKQTTLGKLSIGDAYQCDTLEDVIRERPGVPVAEWKVYGETAIPAGRYRLKLVLSTRFGPDTLSVEDVSGFEAIRIHSGNDDVDTHGCVLVGTAAPDPQGDGGNVTNSRHALAALKVLVVPRLQAGEEGWITIRNPEVV